MGKKLAGAAGSVSAEADADDVVLDAETGQDDSGSGPGPGPAAEAGDAGDAGGQPQEQQPEAGIDPKRAAIFASARARRDAAPDPADDEGDESDEDEAPEAPSPQPQPQPAAQPSARPSTVAVRVGDRVHQISAEEADALLGEAIQRRIAAEEAARNAPPAEAGREGRADGQDSDPSRPRKVVDKARLTQIAEQIQVGDVDAATEALQAILDAAVEAARGSVPDVRAAVREVVQQDDAAAAQQRMLSEIEEQFPELRPESDNPEFAAAMPFSAMRVVQDELRRVGVPEEEIRSFANTPDAAREAYLRLQGQIAEGRVRLAAGVELMDGKSILLKAGERTRARLGGAAGSTNTDRTPAGASIDPGRIGRKQNLAGSPQMRRLATPRPDAGGDPEQQADPASRRAAGFSTVVRNRRLTAVA